MDTARIAEAWHRMGPAIVLGTICVLSQGCSSLETLQETPVVRRLTGNSKNALGAQPSEDDPNWYSRGLAAYRSKDYEDRERRLAMEKKDLERRERKAQLARSKDPETSADNRPPSDGTGVVLEKPSPLELDDLQGRPRLVDRRRTGRSGEPAEPTAPPEREASLAASDRAKRYADAPVADRLERVRGTRVINPTAGEFSGGVASALASRNGDGGLSPSDRLKADFETIDSILNRARTRLDSMATYQLAMVGQERIGDTLREPEKLILSVRREPRAVRLNWPDGPHQGREVIYDSQGPDQLMHVNMSDMGILGQKLAIDPAGLLASKNSRHPITEAGLDTIVEKVELALERQHDPNNDLGELKYEGTSVPEGYNGRCDLIARTTPTGDKWVVAFDRSTGLPAIVEATDPKGRLLERYVFTQVKPNPTDLDTATAFDPQARWGSSGAGGLLGRIARGVDKPAAQAASSSTR